MAEKIDLKQAKIILDKKLQERNKLIGQKEMLIQSLQKLGSENAEQAEQKVKKLTETIEKMKKKKEEGVNLFIKKYGHLLK